MVSENALTSVSLVFPVQNLIIAVSVGTAVGINALLSRRLGEKNYEAANKVANNGVSVTVLTWLVFAAVGALFSTTFMSLCGAEGQVAADGALYMRIVTIFSLGALVEITMERILQVTGKTVYQMISQMSGAVVNIILDPIMIFGLLGFPAMGVAGAAVATVTGQLFAMVVSLLLNHFKNHEAVSYTHLDVYKRQPTPRPPRASPAWRAITGRKCRTWPTAFWRCAARPCVLRIFCRRCSANTCLLYTSTCV